MTELKKSEEILRVTINAALHDFIKKTNLPIRKLIIQPHYQIVDDKYILIDCGTLDVEIRL